MPTQIKLKKVIVYYDEGGHYGIVVYDADEAFDTPYMAGEAKTLVPDQSEIKTSRIIEEPMFNKLGDVKIMADVGHKGALIIRLRPLHRLAKIIVDPNDVIVDIYFDEESLIYTFYNPTRLEAITASMKMMPDDEGILKKLKEAPEDLQWRQYFVRRAMIRPDFVSISEVSNSKRDNLNAAEAADLLGVSEKTIRNWTSEQKIPFQKVGRKVVYSKKQLLQAREERSIGKRPARLRRRS